MLSRCYLYNIDVTYIDVDVTYTILMLSRCYLYNIDVI